MNNRHDRLIELSEIISVREHGDDLLDHRVTRALGLHETGRWTQDRAEAERLVGLTADGGSVRWCVGAWRSGSLWKAALVARDGTEFVPGAGGYSDAPVSAIVVAVLRREAFRIVPKETWVLPNYGF